MRDIRLKDLPQKWDSPAGARLTRRSYAVKLSLRDAARIEALAEIHPGVDTEQIVTDLVSAALDQLEADLPYVPGPGVVATDEFGDPVYEDIGPSRRFHEATRSHLQALEDKENPPESD